MVNMVSQMSMSLVHPQRDSGGPLVYKVDGVWYLIGLTSWGFECANPNNPGMSQNKYSYQFNRKYSFLSACIFNIHLGTWLIYPPLNLLK